MTTTNQAPPSSRLGPDAAKLASRFKRIRTLPKPLQQYLWSGQVEKSFMSAMSKQQVSDARLRAVASKLTGQVLIGELHPNSFIKTLTEQGNIEQDKARGIARDISAQVFAPIRRELMQVYQINKAPGSLAPLPTKTPAPAKPISPTKPQATPKVPTAPPQVTAAPLSEATKRLAGSKRPSAQAPIAPTSMPIKKPAVPQASVAPPPSEIQAAIPKQATPPPPPSSPSKPTVSHDVQSGSIADVAARLKKAKPTGPQAHMVAPGAPPPKTTNSLPRVPSEQNASLDGTPINAPILPQTPKEKPKGPVLTKGELLANEEVVAKDNNKQKHHGIFGHHAKKPKTHRENLLKHKGAPAVPVKPIPQVPPAQNPLQPPPDVLSGNTVNLRRNPNPPSS